MSGTFSSDPASLPQGIHALDSVPAGRHRSAASPFAAAEWESSCCSGQHPVPAALEEVFPRQGSQAVRSALGLADSQRFGRSSSSQDRVRSPKIGLVEVDCDLGAGIPGAAAGIELLRQASRQQKVLRRIHAELIEEIQGRFSPQGPARGPRETGDLTPHARHIHAIHGVLEEAATRVAATRRRGLFPVVLAGDHSTAAGTIAGLRRAHPECRLGVVWIDAHADLHSPYTTPTGNMHGMPLAVAAAHDNHLHGDNNPDPVTLELWEQCKSLAGGACAAIGLGDLVYVSVRDVEPAEAATIRSHGIPVISTEEVRRKGPEQAAARCLDHLRDCELIYVSFDVDSMDATVCVGTGTPAHGGLWADEAIRINRALLGDPRVCCWEICEINPHLDTLDSLAKVSLGVYQAVLEVLEQRFRDDFPAEFGAL